MTYQMALLESKMEGREESTVENLQSIMKNLKLTAEKAMDVLSIPEDKRKHYLKFLQIRK